MKKTFMIPLAIALITLCVVALCVVTGWGVVEWFRPEARVPLSRLATSNSSEDTTRTPSDSATEFVGSRICAECHSKIAESYSKSGMGRSLWTVAEAPDLEDYDRQTSFSPDDRHVYSVERSAAGVFHHERLVDQNGETIYDQKEQIQFALGSGIQGRSFLIERNGRFFLSPIGWYSRAGKWDLSPGYHLPHHKRFSREVNEACLECHTGRMNADPDQLNHFRTPPFFEAAIGCERCHGPGGSHVRFHRDKQTESRDPIVHPGRLSPEAREDVCSQCHLQGEGRILRPGRRFGDFRPGERLEESYIIFIRGTRTKADGSTRAVSQVEQTQESACFTGSGGKFGCISCHDPHAQPPRDDIDQYYRSRCLECHESRGCSLDEATRRKSHQDDSCIACHMPRLTASDVPHTSQTDHRILKRPGSEVPSEEPFDDNPAIFNDADQRLPGLVVNRARGIWLAEQAEFRTDPQLADKAFRLLGPVSRQLPDDVEVWNALGTAAAVQQQFEDALTYWRRSLALKPNQASTLRTAAILLSNMGRHQAARPLMERHLSLQPSNALMWGRYSHLVGQAGQIDQAIEAAEKSRALDPSLPRTYAWLAELYGRKGDTQRREQILRLQERLRSAQSP